MFKTSDLDDRHVAQTHTIINQRMPRGHEGVVMDGSYDADEHVIDMKLGHSEAAAELDDDGQVAIEGAIPLVGPYGMFYAPRGGERVVALPSTSGHNAFLHHGNGEGVARTDVLGKASGIKPGETHWMHFDNQDPVNPKPNSGIKLTEDGAPGDGKGGIIIEAGTRFTVRTPRGVVFEVDEATSTASLRDGSGFGVTVDYANKLVTTGDQGILGGSGFSSGNPAARVVSILDGNGRTISHVAQSIGIGDIPANIPATGALFRQTDISDFSSNIMSQMMQSFSGVYADAMAAAQIPNAPAFALVVKAAGWVTQHITPPTIPTGSAIVKAL